MPRIEDHYDLTAEIPRGYSPPAYDPADLEALGFSPQDAQALLDDAAAVADHTEEQRQRRTVGQPGI